ncbi:hypothetical protein N7491_002579 [Penicillium cf. griseofulvum]|uniref:F-box domain-containing protein n=1 Tax=Penicillium cf. griseofulvum TaxID=2972120 RepID=A0A9W9MSM6_9EURO|nr:hypothetical protein N7472_003237 [Penicillium cf. griseofulvum]KAJ5446497.1 hypothetical protein N7491_002579 [Penicillium cf. griseofulvum]KAJ5448238.1 hypothetical protein N7445_003059 [Penicillium cf. griseofulvum]
MLSELPSEIIYQIATYLPTANALAHLSQTCHRLHGIVTAENSRIFRAFVRSRFSSIDTPPFWKDAAQALTSRSRALERKAIIGRFVVPPENATKIGPLVTRQDNPTLGYRPPIDSYEIWNGQRWADRKEVLAWGAAHQLVMRIKQTGTRSQEDWVVFNDVDQWVNSHDDICSLHLLSSGNHYSNDTNVEHLIFGRVRGDIAHLVISPNEATFEYKQKFMTHGLRLDKTDLSSDTDSTLAAHFEDGSIAFYHTKTDKEEIEPFTWLLPEDSSRTNYSKLLSSSLVAVGTGNVENSLSISKITPDGITACRKIGIGSLDTDSTSLKSKANIGAIEPLNTHNFAGSPGEVFLAAWDDYTVRLHDLRSPSPYEVSYKDITDLNPIYSLHAFGHERFLAGAGAEGLVKIFDLRMYDTYSYLDAQVPASQSQGTQTTNNKAGSTPRTKEKSHAKKGFSIFLSYPPPPTFPQRTPAMVRNRQRGPYRGPIYTMSSPSPSSPTVYTGIVDGVVQLDFASTDDLTGRQKEWYACNLDLGVNTGPEVLPRWNAEAFNLAGYERPAEDDSATTSKLRNQRAFGDLEPKDMASETQGWDCRWESLEEPGAWRRQDR